MKKIAMMIAALVMTLSANAQFEQGKMYVGASNGSKSANSGSVYVLRMSTNGQLSLEKSYKNICGKIVDFETNTSEEE